MRVPFNVDIGVGDVIVPEAEQRKINTQLPDFEAPVIKTCSLESTIAEKFDAILQRFELIGRMKDFYHIYNLSRTFDFEGAKLQALIFETLQRRGTSYDREGTVRISDGSYTGHYGDNKHSNLKTTHERSLVTAHEISNTQPVERSE